VIAVLNSGCGPLRERLGLGMGGEDAAFFVLIGGV